MGKFNIHLNYNKGFTWSNQKNIFFKGQFIFEEKIYTKSEAIDFFKHKTIDELKTIIPKMNGMFSILISWENTAFIATDITRTFPIFYQQKNSIFTITDDPFLFLEHSDFKNQLEFQYSGFTTKNKTLLENVYQTESAQYITLYSDKIETKKYYSYLLQNEPKFDNELLKKELLETLENVHLDLVKELNGRPIILSLSGGYDSRIIAYYLKKLNYNNFKAITYGLSLDDKEVQLAKKTVEKLNIPWVFIKYDEQICHNYFNSKQFIEYVKFNSKLSTFPFLQDYFAVDFLHKKNLINKDSVFLNGYSLDGLAGSLLKGRFNNYTDLQKIKSVLLQDIYTLTKKNEKGTKKIKYILKQQLSNKQAYQSYSAYENWMFKEKVCKMIVNAANVYDFFGYEYRLPLWDMRLTDIFKKWSIQQKNYKSLFNETIQELFTDCDLNFKEELQPTPQTIRIQNVKNQVKKIVPKSILSKLKKKNESHAYHIFTKPMIKELKKQNLYQFTTKDYNSIVVHWYLHFIQSLKEEECL